jgi:hypothetical protein
MSITYHSRTRRIIGRVTQIWSELDHAQRRLLELRTGVALPDRRERPRPR